MADGSWIGNVATAIVAASGGFFAAKRTGAATEKTAVTNGETTLQVKAFEMVTSELKRVQERSDKIEENFRTQYDKLTLEVKGLNERVLTLEVEKANMQVEHSRKERAWETCEGGLNDRIHDLNTENERLNTANGQLRDNQGKLIEYIQTHIDTTYNEASVDILQIGDVEIDRRHKHTDMFREGMARSEPQANGHHQEKDKT